MILFCCKQFPKPIAFCSLLFWLSAELGHLIIIFFFFFGVLFSDQTLYTQQETRKELICQKVEMPIFCKPQNGLAAKAAEKKRNPDFIQQEDRNCLLFSQLPCPNVMQ